MILLDTSGLFCYYHREETLHADAVILFESAIGKITHSYVLAEFIPLCQVRGIHQVRILSFVDTILSNPAIEFIWADKYLYQDALNLLKNHPDKTYSLCDAISFVLMHKRGITDALTTDHHFEQAGFFRLLQQSR